VLLTYLWSLAESGKPVQGVAQKYSEVLRADDTSWARAGAALVAAGHHGFAASGWLVDWRDRESVEAWMLRPLALAFRMLDQDERAVDVCRAAVKLAVRRTSSRTFGVARARPRTERSAEEAAAHVAKIDTVTVSDGTRLVLAMAEAVVMVRQAVRAASRGFREAKTTSRRRPVRVWRRTSRRAPRGPTGASCRASRAKPAPSAPSSGHVAARRPVGEVTGSRSGLFRFVLCDDLQHILDLDDDNVAGPLPPMKYFPSGVRTSGEGCHFRGACPTGVPSFMSYTPRPESLFRSAPTKYRFSPITLPQ